MRDMLLRACDHCAVPRRLYLVVLSGAYLVSVMTAGVAIAADPVSFSNDVRPILSQNCFKCHGPDEGSREGGLRLDLWESASQPADSGEVPIVPGSLSQSEVVKRIDADESERMPPPSSNLTLTESQKNILKNWISQGAHYETHWAFVAPQKANPPTSSDAAWNDNVIDRFVFAKLAERQLTPQQPANPYEIVRRVFLDLIGLPPTVEQADRFAADPSDQAYERVVDELLQSPDYGERWARKWLDLARYADTNGYEKDRLRSIWPYRDWVIKAIQNDMPFDQFTIEQLAGDMLPNATLEQRIATGFHRNTMLNEEGGIDPLEFRYYAMTDRTATTGTTWLGLTIGCAQCHTHKFDPISHHEYYGLFALLNNADEPELPVPQADFEEKQKETQRQIDKLKGSLAERFPVPTDIVWTTLTPFNAKSINSNIRIREQNTVWVEELSQPTDTFTLSLRLPKGIYSELRIEALADENLPSMGPGLTPHGNFVLTEVSASLDSAALKFTEASADFSQPNFSASDSIDGKADTGWAIHGSGTWNVNRTLTLKLDKPLDLHDDGSVTVELAFDYGAKHVLGKFRIAAGSPIDTSVPFETRREKVLAQKLDLWIKEQSAKVNQWQIAHPVSAVATTPLLTILDDHSIFATGDFAKSDSYKIDFEDVPVGTTGFRLEVLPDERLPKGGPGATYYEGPLGDFFLSEVEIRCVDQLQEIAEATHSFASGDNTAAKCIDGNKQSGWSIDGGQRQRHVAVFELAEPTAVVGQVSISMLCERWYAPGIGRFRWSYTTEPVGAAHDLNDEVANHLSTSSEHWSAAQREEVRNAFLEHTAELAEVRQELKALKGSLIPSISTLVMQERPSNNPRVTHLYHRGEFLQPRDAVEPHTPQILNTQGSLQPKTRLEFAKWLVSPNNPLTARVTVNRAWEAFFGHGIVRTSQDFGYQGDPPTHPELLDYMAVDFVENGWSMKYLHKQIVMSRTYRQAGQVRPIALEKDPDNRWLSRGPRNRLDAEIIRDQALAVAGLLSTKVGGPSVFPPQPPNVTTEGTYGAFAWSVSPGEDRFRKSLYTFAKRTSPFALTATFDAPSGEACIARREVTNTPLQALSMLNDVTFKAAIEELGRQTDDVQGSNREKLSFLFRSVLIRPASQAELDDLENYFNRQCRRLLDGELKSAEIVSGSRDADSRSDQSVSQAAWALVARVLLNVDEAVTK